MSAIQNPTGENKVVRLKLNGEPWGKPGPRKSSSDMRINPQNTIVPKSPNDKAKESFVSEISMGKRNGIHLLPDQNDLFIRLAEKEMIEAASVIDSIRQNYEEAKTMYDEQLLLWNAANERKNKAEHALTLLTNYKNYKSPDAPTRVMRTTSVADEPHRATTERIEWLSIAEAALQSANKFLSYEHLLNKMQTLSKEASEAFNETKGSKRYYYIQKQKILIYERIERNSQMTQLHEKRGGKRLVTKTFTIFQHKIGLFEWLDDNGKPFSQYLKDFMYQSDEIIISSNKTVSNTDEAAIGNTFDRTFG